jgi:hypothetical protein
VGASIAQLIEKIRKTSCSILVGPTGRAAADYIRSGLQAHQGAADVIFGRCPRYRFVEVIEVRARDEWARSPYARRIRERVIARLGERIGTIRAGLASKPSTMLAK